MTLADQVAVREGFAEAPLRAGAPVETFREGFREAVGEGLGEDRAVVVVVLLEAGAKLGEAVARGDGEEADVVATARGPGRDEVGERLVRGVAALLLLLRSVWSVASGRSPRGSA